MIARSGRSAFVGIVAGLATFAACFLLALAGGDGGMTFFWLGVVLAPLVGVGAAAFAGRNLDLLPPLEPDDPALLNLIARQEVERDSEGDQPS